MKAFNLTQKYTEMRFSESEDRSLLTLREISKMIFALY